MGQQAASTSTNKKVLTDNDQIAMELGQFCYQNPPTPDDLTYSPVFIFTTSLPHRQLQAKDVDENGMYVCRNGIVELKIMSTEGRHGIPFGKHARLAWIYLAHTIKRHGHSLENGTRLRLDTSYAQMCKALRVDPSGGHSASAKCLLDQWVRLLTCTFVISWHSVDDKGQPVTTERKFHINAKTEWRGSGPKTLTRSDWTASIRTGVELSQDLVTELREHTMPLDERIFSHICKSRSCMRIDLYGWLCWRINALHDQRRRRSGRPPQSSVFVSWRDLFNQTGSGYKALRDFVRAVRREIADLRLLWPGLEVDDSRKDGLIIYASSQAAVGANKAARISGPALRAGINSSPR